PVHCVADSTGAEFDPLLSTAAITHEVRKGQGRPDYSAFQGTTETGSSLGELLAELTVTELDVVGIATDHCVRASALDAVESGGTVRVRTDLAAGVGEESSEAALSEVETAGGQLACTAPPPSASSMLSLSASLIAQPEERVVNATFFGLTG